LKRLKKIRIKSKKWKAILIFVQIPYFSPKTFSLKKKKYFHLKKMNLNPADLKKVDFNLKFKK